MCYTGGMVEPELIEKTLRKIQLGQVDLRQDMREVKASRREAPPSSPKRWIQIPLKSVILAPF